MSDSVQLTVVMPAYDEAASLELLLPRMHRTLGELGVSHEILVIDAEHGTPNTEEVCARNCVRYEKRRGGSQYGAAVRTAQLLARGAYVVFIDADGSHSPEFIAKLWASRNEADLVIASRYVAGGATENPAILILMSRIVNIGFRVVLGLDCHDVSNSYRLYYGDHFRALQLECAHFDIIEEMLVKLVAAHPGYRVKELPFTFERRKAGKTKRQLLLFAFEYFWTLVHLRRLQNETRRRTGAK